MREAMDKVVNRVEEKQTARVFLLGRMSILSAPLFKMS
ncbi:MAG: phosphogluconate dehydrogenase C-terminal domain-containing protein [Granulosicoccus sp.]